MTTISKSTTTSTKEAISPLGSTAQGAAGRRYARSAEYRAEHDRLAPYRAIADAVIIARGAKHLTQKQLGEAIGTTDSAISRIESGRNPVTLETLSKLGETLGLAFMVGSEKVARGAKLGNNCVVVPERGFERPTIPAASQGPESGREPAICGQTHQSHQTLT